MIPPYCSVAVVNEPAALTFWARCGSKESGTADTVHRSGSNRCVNLHQKSDFKQLVACNLKLQFHETDLLKKNILQLLETQFTHFAFSLSRMKPLVS